MKYEVVVSAGPYYPSLCSDFPGYDIRLSYENDHLGMQFSAYSPHIENLGNAKHIGRRLYSLNLLLKGVLNIAHGRYLVAPLKFTGFGGNNLSGSVWPDTFEEDPFDPNCTLEEHEISRLRDYSPAFWLHKCKSDSDLRRIVYMAGLTSNNSFEEQIFTWGNLYKILDSIRHLCKSKGIILANIADENKLEEFTAACNNMSILGLFSRHGAKGNAPPTRVMTDLTEAINLILTVANRFLRQYTKETPPAAPAT